MTASGGLYPSLGRYFENSTELAHAGCMSRTRLRDCLNGKKTFTRAEKKAISANIAMKLLNSKSYDYSDLENANRAYKGEFDEVYKVKAS
jgi:hypothetical protein